MDATTYHSPATRSTVLTFRTDDRDLARMMHPDEILRDVREQIARRLVDRVMEILGPGIERAIVEAAAELGKPAETEGDKGRRRPAREAGGE